jgi:2-oxoisovalerate dehydrogenase E2 component (dihydrolipoyl transacylase)
MNVFKLPDLGEGLSEAEIVQWHVAEGDEVRADQTLVSVETDKAVVDVPSPESGRIRKLYGEPGDVIQVGEPLVEFAGGADTGTVVGEMRTSDEVIREETGGRSRRGDTGVKATPAVRALAKRLEVDLNAVRATGPDGLITAADVRRAAQTLQQAGPLEPLKGVRRAMALNMARAHAEVVPVTLVDEADVESWPEKADTTLRLIRALVAGCRAEPSLNAWYDGHAVGRRLPETVHLGIAVDTPDGLFVARLDNADRRSPEDLRAGLDRLKADVQARSIPAEELRGYTITLSNFGTIAGRHATPIVMPPTVAILGAGRIRPAVVAAEGQPAVHRVLPLSLTFDHRAVSGGEAGRFLAAVIADLERAE